MPWSTSLALSSGWMSSKTNWSIPIGALGWGDLLNERLEKLGSRVESLEALLLAIQKDLPAIIEHCPETAKAATEIAMRYMEDK